MMPWLSFPGGARSCTLTTATATALGLSACAGGECAGASQLAGLSRLGSVSFSRSEANARVVAHWGAFRTVSEANCFIH